MLRILILLLFLVSAFDTQAQTLRSRGHRLVFTDAEATAGWAKASGTAAEQAQHAAFMTRMNAWCTEAKLATVKNIQCAEYLVLAHRADPTTYSGDWADGACELLRWSIDTTDGVNSNVQDTTTTRRSGNEVRWYGPRVAALWDEFGSHCDTIDTTIGDKFRDYATYMWDYHEPFGLSSATTGYQNDNNIGIGVFKTILQIAFAAYDSTAFPTAATWISTMKTLQENYINNCQTASTAASNFELCYGSSGSEGMNEYGPETRALLTELILAWSIATTDVDYRTTLNGIFPRSVVQWTLAGTSPTGPTGTYVSKLVQPFYYRDVNVYGYMYFYSWDMVVMAMRMLNQQGDTTYHDYALWWLKTYMPKPFLSNGSEAWFEWKSLLFVDADATGTDYRNVVSTDYTTPFMLLSRSDWTDDATWLGMLAMNEAGQHMHGDTGNFGIYRKGKWLTREIPGYGSGAATRTVNASASHNVLTLNNHGSMGAYGRGTTQAALGRMARRTGGTISSCNEAYCAARFELAPTYRFTGYQITPHVDTVWRDVLYLKPDITIVADRFKFITGLNSHAIFHVQSEKAAASISGNLATISNASQRLHVTTAYPSTATYKTPLQTFCKVIDIKPLNSDTAFMFLDCIHQFVNGNTITISGLTGAWSGVNDTYTISQQVGSSGTQPYSDGIAYNVERIKVTSVGKFAGLPAFDPAVYGYGETNRSKPVTWNDPDINPTSPGTAVTHTPYRLDIGNGRDVNEDAFLVVMEGADSTATPMTVTPLVPVTSNVMGAAFVPPNGSLTEVISPTLTTPTFPMSITRTGVASNHKVLGMTPGTTYKVSDAGNVITINTSGSGASVVANDAGILEYQVDASIETPAITIVATPPSVSFSCVAGASNPANQTDVVITATGDGGEAAITPSVTELWITTLLSGGAAPQTTPQTLSVSFDCSTLSPGTYNTDITITSATPYVINASMTIGVTLTVTASPILAAFPPSTTFTATVGQSNPADQTITVTRTTSGNLGTITNDSGGWLTVSPTTATSITSQDLTLSVDIAGLAVGLYTATVSVPSTGAGNTPLQISVTLGINPPIVVGLEPQVGTDRVRVRYTAPSRDPCTVRACTDDSCNTEISSASDGGGHPIRDFTLAGLTEDTSATLQTICGTDIKARQIRTKAAGGPTRSFPLDLTDAYGAATISVKYGATASMTETPVTGGCSAGRCTATITWPNANRIIYFQPLFKDIGGATIHTGPIQSQLLVP